MKNGPKFQIKKHNQSRIGSLKSFLKKTAFTVVRQKNRSLGWVLFNCDKVNIDLMGEMEKERESKTRILEFVTRMSDETAMKYLMMAV